MPTYNFTTGGEIFVDNRLMRSIDGPAALTPRADADYFTIRYLDGSDLLYYTPNTFEIDGEEFEGTITEFCDAAEALFTSEGGGGGGESYPDISANTTIEIASAMVLNIVDDEGKTLIRANNNATTNNTFIGDPDTVVGWNSHINVNQEDDGSQATSNLGVRFNDYEKGADIYVVANSGNVNASMSVYGDSSAAVTVFEAGINLLGVVEYADNAAALTGGLTAGFLYRTGDALKIVH